MGQPPRRPPQPHQRPVPGANRPRTLERARADEDALPVPASPRSPPPPPRHPSPPPRPPARRALFQRSSPPPPPAAPRLPPNARVPAPPPQRPSPAPRHARRALFKRSSPPPLPAAPRLPRLRQDSPARLPCPAPRPARRALFHLPPRPPRLDSPPLPRQAPRRPPPPWAFLRVNQASPSLSGGEKRGEAPRRPSPPRLPCPAPRPARRGEVMYFGGPPRRTLPRVHFSIAALKARQTVCSRPLPRPATPPPTRPDQKTPANEEPGDQSAALQKVTEDAEGSPEAPRRGITSAWKAFLDDADELG